VTACDSSTYSMLTCTVFDLHSIQRFITHRYWYWQFGIGQYYWVLGIWCHVWYRSNPIHWLRYRQDGWYRSLCVNVVLAWHQITMCTWLVRRQSY